MRYVKRKKNQKKLVRARKPAGQKALVKSPEDEVRDTERVVTRDDLYTSFSFGEKARKLWLASRGVRDVAFESFARAAFDELQDFVDSVEFEETATASNRLGRRRIKHDEEGEK